MLLLARISLQKPPIPSPSLALIARHLSTASTSSKLHDHYSFKPPPSLSPEIPQKPNPTPRKKRKPLYRPPSSLDPIATKLTHSDLPFDFRYSYTESSLTVRPIGLREPKYSPFGPGRLDRVWTGVCAPAVDPKVKSLEGKDYPNLEEKRRMMRQEIQGEPLNNAERKILWKIVIGIEPRSKLTSDLVPCILVTFEKEQIVVWRGKDYKPAVDELLFTERKFFDDPESSGV
ncbi:hypothetical protein GH714_019608 [Hevea brasiliensis]|uniref:CRM domain-containing protein n=1 Tax=Hevea brasiliensis TaxID=3981 RepID=A0A6A6MBT8_HEVBR|nr:hypothetical protein GH714_019608 [Hevea brasiliensis]